MADSIALKKLKRWHSDPRTHTLIVCHPIQPDQLDQAFLAAGISTPCDACGSTVSAYPASIERAQRDPNAHIVCIHCYTLAQLKAIAAGFKGRVTNNKFIDFD